MEYKTVISIIDFTRKEEIRMKYRVRYRLSNDYEMVVNAKDNVEAREVAELKFDPDNQYDWTHIISIEKVNKEESNGC